MTTAMALTTTTKGEASDVRDEGHDDEGKDHNDKSNTSDPHHRLTSSSGSSKSGTPKLRHALSFGHRKEAGLRGGAGVRWYHNLFPLNQKFEPRVEYPLWDDDW